MKKMIRLKYPAIFEVNPDGISILFPDIPECLSCGYSKRHAYKMAKEALELALYGVKIDELPARTYPVKRFCSKKLYIRPVTAKFEIKDNRLFDENVIVFSDTEKAGDETLKTGDGSLS